MWAKRGFVFKFWWRVDQKTHSAVLRTFFKEHLAHSINLRNVNTFEDGVNRGKPKTSKFLGHDLLPSVRALLDLWLQVRKALHPRGLLPAGQISETWLLDLHSGQGLACEMQGKSGRVLMIGQLPEVGDTKSSQQPWITFYSLGIPNEMDMKCV